MASAPKILIAAPFHHLEPSLAPRVRSLGGGDPLAHRRVVVISNRLRDHVHGVLARAGGFAGVEVLSMIDLADKTAEPERALAGFTRPHPTLAEVLAEEAFSRARGEFVFFESDTRGYGESLCATLTDLAEANLSPETLRELSGKIPGRDAARLRDLALLAERFGSCMREREYCDRSSLFLEACERAEADPPRVPTIFYGFAEMNALQRRLAAAVCREARSQALVPAQPGAPACAHAEPLIDWFERQGFRREEAELSKPRPLSGLAGALFSRDGARAEPLKADALRVVAAPTRGREVREVCREMLKAREDCESDDEVCVLMTARGGYQDLFEDTFHNLEIPGRSEDRHPLSETPAARLFLLMLRLLMEGYPRAELMRFMDEGGFTGSQRFQELARKYEFEERVGDPAFASRWEFFSRSLPYLRGPDAWQSALEGALKQMREGDEERPAAYSLAKSIYVVFELIEKIPGQGPPSSFVQSALDVFSETTSGLADIDAVREVLSHLAELDEVTGEMNRERFHDLCERFLEKTALRGNEPDEGHLVSLSSIQGARGLSFDAVVLAGLGEGLFPPTGTEDPLLPDSVREKLNRAALESFPERGAALPLKKSRESEARFQLWTILQSARKRLILTATSREDGLGNEAASFPSMFLHYLADALGEAGDGAWGLFAESRSRTAAATLDTEAMSRNPAHLREYDLALMATQIGRPEAGGLFYMNDFPGFLRRRGALSERWRPGALTEHDGMLAAPDLRELIEARVHSPAWPLGVTSLEKFFVCPYRFVNDRLYPRMEKREEPAPPFALDGLLRGELTHRILEFFHLWLKEQNRPLYALDETTTQEALREAIRKAMTGETEKAGSPLLPALPWAVLEDALYRRLRGYLELMRADGSGRLPVSVEERFGGRDSEPLRISLESGELALGGRMDLLDRNEAGEYRVVDFKTVGSRSSVPARTKVLDGGASLQLHLYARHLCSRPDALPEDAPVSGAYVYVTEEEGVVERARSCEEVEGRMADVDALLEYFLASAGEGRFFPTPSNDACRYCDYKLLCGPDRAERSARKEGAQGVSELRVLRENAS
ncbi:MAG: PD-(D/E)XK nuclease family protein [Nitrospinae bacterium]|nr:PD-(D/E)XK nuclease family protein [Nitrospinota bacterium]